MKKQILNLGKALNKAEQKLINGGDEAGPCKDAGALCHTQNTNPNNQCCNDCDSSLSIEDGMGLCT